MIHLYNSGTTRLRVSLRPHPPNLRQTRFQDLMSTCLSSQLRQKAKHIPTPRAPWDASILPPPPGAPLLLLGPMSRCHLSLKP